MHPGVFTPLERRRGQRHRAGAGVAGVTAERPAPGPDYEGNEPPPPAIFPIMTFTSSSGVVTPEHLSQMLTTMCTVGLRVEVTR